MSRVPSGNITFLFTDIEGSTKLAQNFPETHRTSLDRHYSILQNTIGSNNGFVFEIVGDGFCCAFENAKDAVNAAVEAQLNIANEKWKDARIKIRIGIHSGNAEWNGKMYIGYITLARTARIMSAAYGEQILISKDTYNLISQDIFLSQSHEDTKSRSDDLVSWCLNGNKKISFRDLGERRLKDLIQPLKLFQVVATGLREEFPPLKTLDARPNNLPIQLTSFIGREAESKNIKELLKKTHLLTLTGPGGAGKTRLALEVSADVIDEYANGVWFVELASLSEPILLANAIIKVLGVIEQPRMTIEELLFDYIKDKEILLILDNCEHLIDSVSQLTQKLLMSSPKLKIIATSREALRCEGEQTHKVLPLKYPDPNDKESTEILIQYESVKLFIERALRVNANFNINNDNARALAQICFKLDGIPLAIELASARTKALSVEQIYQRLDDRFNLLTGGKRTSLPRQQTLKATIDWSYDLLSENEKMFWNRLSIFAGGWTLKAAEEICSDEEISEKEIVDLLTQLTEKSIIIFDDGKERYSMLETIRQYGEEKLNEENENEYISNRHLKYYMELAEIAEEKLKGPEIAEWLSILDMESGNVERGLTWSTESSAAKDINANGVRLAAAMGYFWDIRGNVSEGLRWLQIPILKKTSAKNSIYYKIIYQAGKFFRQKGDYGKAIKFFEECLNFYRKNNDKHGIAYTLYSLGLAAQHQGKFDKAADLFNQSLNISKEIGDKHSVSISLAGLGDLAYYHGEYSKAYNLIEECLEISREVGNKRTVAITLLNLGHKSRNQGEFIKASKYFEEGLNIARENGDKTVIASSLHSLGDIAVVQGDYANAARLVVESSNIFGDVGDKRGIAGSLCTLADIALSQKDYTKALSLFEKSLNIFKEIGHNEGEADLLLYLGNLSLEKGESNQASKFFRKSMSIFRKIGAKPNIAISLYGLGKIAFGEKEYEEAIKYHNESLTLSRTLGMKKEIIFNILKLTELHFIAGNNFAGQYFSTSKLLGFAKNYFIINKIKLTDSEQITFDELMLRSKENLSEEEFSRYFEEGKSLSTDNAIEIAYQF